MVNDEIDDETVHQWCDMVLLCCMVLDISQDVLYISVRQIQEVCA